MKPVVADNLTTIERKESHLWFITLGLLLLFAGILIATYFVIVNESYLGSGELESTIYKALWGLSILTVLFSLYVLHSRSTFRKVKKLFEVHALRDSLTGLYLRYYFEELVIVEIIRADRYGENLAILLCDVDKFKAINDNHGHQVGDEILRKVAQGIREATRGNDLVCRWGGDEMVVVLSKVTREGMLIAADRIRKKIINIGEKSTIPVDISIGVSFFPEHGHNIDELIRMADRALYIAKKGGDKIHVGEEEYPLDSSAVNIVFQPIFDTRSEQILGYEALSRDPQGKLTILELFKRYQAVGQLKELKTLCFHLQLKKAEELGIPKVFINIDFNVLNGMKTIPTLKGTEVILEISESEALHNVEGFLQIAKDWRSKGFKFAIDDFGAGFISLPFTARLLPDYIKLDRSTIV